MRPRRTPYWSPEFESGADSGLGSENRAPYRTPDSNSGLRTPVRSSAFQNSGLRVPNSGLGLPSSGLVLPNSGLGFRTSADASSSLCFQCFGTSTRPITESTPDSNSVLSTEFESGAHSVLGFGNRAPYRTPYSSSVLRTGVRNIALLNSGLRVPGSGLSFQYFGLGF